MCSTWALKQEMVLSNESPSTSETSDEEFRELLMSLNAILLASSCSGWAHRESKFARKFSRVLI
eukprot:snap_masked-scaffold_22-processed-gene-3.10-mRNA-1 protein AED:1.00 eAED:1.00 QI:0/-1/0/0/-1/1/1/0/63